MPPAQKSRPPTRPPPRYASVDEYLAKQEPAKAATLRAIIACIRTEFPELEAVIAWNVPTLRREEENVATLCAFQNHLSYAPWSNQILQDFKGQLRDLVVGKHSFQLPVDWSVDRDLLMALVRARLAELDHGRKQPPRLARATPSVKKPAEADGATDLPTALAATPVAQAAWEKLTPIARRDFLTWIATAKQGATRARRIERTCRMLVEGKRRPCCYSIVSSALHLALASTPQAKARWHELTPDQRRDFIGWMDAAKEPTAHRRRIQQSCVRLAAGMNCP